MGHQTAEAHSSSLVLGCAARNSSGSQTSSTRSLGSPPRLRVTPTETVCKNALPEVCSLPPLPHLAFPNLSSSPEPFAERPSLSPSSAPFPLRSQTKRVQTRKTGACARVLDDVHEKYRFQGREKNLQMNHPPDLPRKKKRKARGG